MRWSQQDRNTARGRVMGAPLTVIFALTVFLCTWLPAPSARGQEPEKAIVSPGNDQEPAAAEPAGGSALHDCRPGPWGHLEYYETYLEAPAPIVESMPIPSRRTLWRFPKLTMDDVWDLLKKVGLPEDIMRELEDNAGWFVSEAATHVLPTEKVLTHLTPEHRRQIYATLGQWRENPFQRNPILINPGDEREWLKRADLPADIVDLVERVSYPYGEETAFSDVPLILSKMSNRAQERRFLKAITRTRSLIVRICLDGSQDLGEVANYWSLGSQFKDSQPLLGSVARHPEVDRLDIAHLLPPIPRKHLYTFPAFPSGYSGRYPDSFWTVFNFFEFWPTEIPEDGDEIDERLRSGFRQVESASRYGDVIVFRDPGTKRPLHGCVFIADEIVYTKNGASVLRPWILTRLPDLLRHWSRPHPPTIETWRRERIPEIEGLKYNLPDAMNRVPDFPQK